ncbi:MAG: NADH-quinone oxidoreductase subunit NuoE [Syntrophomonadaceae bacterium]|nr:NADH-quinone oxidoreductase subunit NuoE [Syntrophomonadaceae bacterium]
MSCQCKGDAACCQPDIEAGMAALDALIDRYGDDPGNLITVLQGAQDIYRYLPLPVMQHIAQRMDIRSSRVYGVATFYAQFRFEPVGKHLILLCQGTACHVNGADQIETALADELKLKMGETSADQLFTLSSAACLGCCSLAPVMMINGTAYGPLTPDKARAIIRDIRKQEEAQGGVAVC